MSEPAFALWVYLSRTPLLWLTVTLVAYVIADRVSAATGRHPLANPVLHSVWLIAGVLALSGTPYRTYFDGAQFVHFLLGPATVALAVPLYENRQVVLRSLGPMVLALAVGSLTALASALVIAQLFGAPHSVLASLAPKSVTAAVAMGIAERLGGDAALTAVIVILTGIIGAVVVTPLMDGLRITDWRARVRRRTRRPRDRHRARLPGASAGGDVRGNRDGSQRASHGRGGAGRDRVVCMTRQGAQRAAPFRSRGSSIAPPVAGEPQRGLETVAHRLPIG